MVDRKASSKSAKVVAEPTAPALDDLQARLAAIEPFGFRLRKGRSIADLFADFSRDDYLSNPDLFYAALGWEYDWDDPSRPTNCDQAWALDAECIRGPGAYVAVARAFVRMADGHLPLKRVRDHVDFENATAWLEFTLDGERMHWDFRVEDDWIDFSVIKKFDRLLSSRTTRRFLVHTVNAQEFVIVGIHPKHIAAFRRVTGLKWTLPR